MSGNDQLNNLNKKSYKKPSSSQLKHVSHNISPSILTITISASKLEEIFKKFPKNVHGFHYVSIDGPNRAKVGLEILGGIAEITINFHDSVPDGTVIFDFNSKTNTDSVLTFSGYSKEYLMTIYRCVPELDNFLNDILNGKFNDCFAADLVNPVCEPRPTANSSIIDSKNKDIFDFLIEHKLRYKFNLERGSDEKFCIGIPKQYVFKVTIGYRKNCLLKLYENYVLKILQFLNINPNVSIDGKNLGICVATSFNEISCPVILRHGPKDKIKLMLVLGNNYICFGDNHTVNLSYKCSYELNTADLILGLMNLFEQVDNYLKQ